MADLLKETPRRKSLSRKALRKINHVHSSGAKLLLSRIQRTTLRGLARGADVSPLAGLCRRLDLFHGLTPVAKLFRPYRGSVPGEAETQLGVAFD